MYMSQYFTKNTPNLSNGIKKLTPTQMSDFRAIDHFLSFFSSFNILLLLLFISRLTVK
jgi:hypothetical protein